MKFLRYAIFGLVLIVIILVGVVAVVLPRVASSPEVQEKIRVAAQASLGRDVSFEKLSFGLLPPELVVEKTLVAGETPGDAPFLSAEKIGLRIALLPLFFRSVVVDSLQVDGATLTVIRDAEGLRLPGPADTDSEVEPSSEETSSEGSGLALAVRDLQLKNVSLVLDDRSVSPPVVWNVKDLDLQASISLVGEKWSVSFDLNGGLGAGVISGKGHLASSGVVEVELELSEIDLAQANSYLAPGQSLAGKAGGSLALTGKGSEIENASVDLAVKQSDFQFDEVKLKGLLVIKGNLEGVPPRASGKVEIDATQAEIIYAESVRKTVGTAAKLNVGLVPSEDGTLVAELLGGTRLHNLDLLGTVRQKDRIHVALKPFRIDFQGWEKVLPALEGSPISGVLESEGLALATDPLDVQGRFQLRDLTASLSESGKAVLRGPIVAKGDAVEFDAIEIVLAEQVIHASGALTGLAGTMAYRLKLSGKELEMEKVFGELSDADPFLSGPMDIGGDIHGVMGDASVLQATKGELSFLAGPGNIDGVSLLEGTFEGMASVAEAAALLAKLEGKEIEKYYSDEFETASGTLHLADGKATTDDLKLVYENYTVDLKGVIFLETLKIDFTGYLTLDEEVDEALADRGESYEGKKKAIRLTRITGTLQEPKVHLGSRDIAALVASYGLAEHRETLSKEIDEHLGEGAGEEILDILEGGLLDGILGGKKKSP